MTDVNPVNTQEAVSDDAAGTHGHTTDIVEQLRSYETFFSDRPELQTCLRAAVDEIERLRALICGVVENLENEDGDQIGVCVEPIVTDLPTCVRHSDGLGFDLIKPFTDELWNDLAEIACES